jgi:DNA-binding NarL/FixJ family response regulator
MEQVPGWEIIGEVGEFATLWAALQHVHPDVLLMDWELPGLLGSEAICNFKEICPQMAVVAMSSQIDARKTALDAHADAFVSKGDPPEAIINTLRSIANSTFPATHID